MHTCIYIHVQYICIFHAFIKMFIIYLRRARGQFQIGTWRVPATVLLKLRTLPQNLFFFVSSWREFLVVQNMFRGIVICIAHVYKYIPMYGYVFVSYICMCTRIHEYTYIHILGWCKTCFVESLYPQYNTIGILIRTVHTYMYIIYVHVHFYVYVYFYVWICSCIMDFYLYTYTYVHVYICTRVHMCMYISMHKYVYVCVPVYVYVYIHMYMYMGLYVYIYIYIYMYVYIYIYVYRYICIYTFMHRCT